MLEIKVFDDSKKPNEEDKDRIVDFLYYHLEQYGDPKTDIKRCLNYSVKDRDSFGGFVLEGIMDGETVGAVLVNETGMGGYIPENILVYIATHKDYRGKGIGKQLMEKTIEMANGDIALHVEPDNPARFLYEKYKFNNKYLEMRYKSK